MRSPPTRAALSCNLLISCSTHTFAHHGLTHKISSAAPLSTPAYAPLQIIRGRELAPSFNIYIDAPKGKIDDNGRTLSRKILRWNGKFYH